MFDDKFVKYVIYLFIQLMSLIASEASEDFNNLSTVVSRAGCILGPVLVPWIATEQLGELRRPGTEKDDQHKHWISQIRADT